MGVHPCDNWNFELNGIASVAMKIQVKYLLDTFGLLDKVIAYVKNEILI
jgi:hypothetical protein